MDSGQRQLGALLALHFEAIILVVAAVYGGRWMNEQHWNDWNWLIVTILLAVSIIAVSAWNLFRK